MPFFQHSVLNKYLKTQDEEKVKSAYKQFAAYFHEPVRQQNIKESKEEQFQEGFLRELFVKILGYTLNPEPNFNLTTELKNEKGAKKTDGAILKDGKALGVIELKGTDTKDLDKVNEQAFNYKNNHAGCVYVITSNFEKLRFFIHNAVEHIEYNLFKLDEDEFKLLWLCLQANNLLNGIPLKVKEESLLAEENITKQLYKDYASFKTALWQNMVKNHPNDDKLMLFKKTQKLLDRFLFIFFAEDSGLLPPNSISRIVKRWEILKEEDAYKPLYDIFNQYFGYINKGRRGKVSQDDIFAYNGGLFQPDLILNSITIDDEVLHPHVMKLTAYDFQSEVDVNILGHIFENSLGEIENITAQLEGQEVDKSKSKRKKDGVFYTPKYITKYIVENTIGKLCEEKKAELIITDERFGQAGKRSQKGITDLQAYRDWLLDLKICDPACGSGAFLNQALEFLIEEHHYLDELTAHYHKSPMVLSDIETQILEQNIYGVDINDESVEIAKLSLWLRTAQRGRKLTTLNNNIKCGNSLIDDPEVGGEKAFNWQKEFPDIFKKKQKEAWHVTWVTHDTRTSKRMIEFKVRDRRADGKMHVDRSIILEAEDAIKVTEFISQFVIEDKYNCLAYNICNDHVHIVLVCEKAELDNIVGKLKGKSAQKFKEFSGIPKDETFHLWAQKFNKKPITSDEQLHATINYINNNRKKHALPDINKGLQPLVEKMICDIPHAFRKEYKGGFDVVIGNPPYVTRGMSEILKSALNANFQTAQYQLDLYVAFIEKGISLTRQEGILSYIVPNSWLKNMMMSGCRKFLLNNLDVTSMIPSLENVFPDASVDTMIFTGVKHELKKGIKSQIYEFINKELRFRHNVTQERFLSNDGYIFDVEVNEEVLPIINKMKENVALVGEIFDVTRGFNPYDKYTGQSPETIKTRAYHANYRKDNSFVPELKGKHTARYFYKWDNKHFISYGDWLAAPRQLKYFEGPRIIFREILGKNFVSALITEDFKIDRSLYIAILEQDKKSIFDIKCILGILNSSLMAFFFRYSNNEFDNLFPKIRLAEFKKLPIKIINIDEQNALANKVNRISISTKDRDLCISGFTELLLSKYAFGKPSRKLQNWHELEFKDFLKELKKAKVKLSLPEEAEWMQYFNEQKQIAQELKSEINRVDAEIDKMVYELYELTEEEIKIVEGN